MSDAGLFEQWGRMVYNKKNDREVRDDEVGNGHWT